MIGILNSQDIISNAQNDINYLTSPELMGRGYTFDGHLKASSYIKTQYENIGLKSPSTGYLQAFEFEVNLFESTPSLKINGKELVLGIDYFPYATSGSGQLDEGNVYFVGSGLYIPDKNINEYSKISNSGAILIMIEQIPDELKGDKSIKKEYFSRSFRLDIAKQLKASAVIFLVDNLSFSTPYMREEMPIFDVLMSNFPKSVEYISFSVETSVKDVESNNVIGFLPGQIESDSTIILCAHYDHLSAFPDSTYFPGANDNASGVGLLLSMARYFKSNPLNISLVFIAFSGEDAGLCGSKYYAENPVYDLGYVKFLINFDMVASGENGIVAVGGVDNPKYFDLLVTANDSLKIGKLRRRKNAPNGDHYFLTQKGVKAFFLYTDKGKQPYHSVNDIYETLEWDDFSSVFQLSKSFIRMIDIE